MVNIRKNKKTMKRRNHSTTNNSGVSSLQMRNKRKRMSVRRTRRGGDIMYSLGQIEANNKMLLAEMNRFEDDNDESTCDISDIKLIAEKTNQMIRNFINETRQVEQAKKIKDELMERNINKNDELGVSNSVLDNKIELGEFSGTVGDLIKKIKKDVDHLEQTNSNAYKEHVKKLKLLESQIQKSIDSVTNVKKSLTRPRKNTSEILLL